MSISLKKSIILPDEWNVTPNSLSHIEECYKEAFELGFVIEDEYNEIMAGASVACYFWCSSNSYQMRLAGHFTIYFMFIDEYLDSNKLCDNESKEFLKRHIFLLIEGKLPSNPSRLERHALFVRDLALKYSNGRIEVFNAFISIYIDWLNSVIPLAKLSEYKSYPPYQIQQYIRTINIGCTACQGVTLILYKDQIEDISFLENPRYRQMLSLSSDATAHINDIISYCKEVNAGCGNTNILSNLQQGGLSFEDAFNSLCNQISQLVKEFQYHELTLKKSIPNLPVVLIDHLKYLLKGTFLFSLAISKRYTTPNSPFLELNQSYCQTVENLKE